MSMNSEDSLNDRSEDLNTMRMKLGGQKKDVEPTRKQLIATGELDPDDPEALEEVEPEGGAGGTEGEPETPSTGVAIPDGKQLNVRKQIVQRLLAGASREELVAEGFNKGSVRTIASELKSKLNTNRAIGKAPMTTSKGLPIFAHGSPPEAIIDSITVPDVANGQGYAFEQGIKFGMSLITIGVRMAQEMSAIGVQQSKPIIDMAKSMREGEAMASKNAASEAAMEAAGMVRDSMMPMLTNLQRSGGGGEGGDPMKNMMARTMEPIIQRLMGGVLGRLAPGTQPVQLTEGQGKVDGWTRKSE